MVRREIYLDSRGAPDFATTDSAIRIRSWPVESPARDLTPLIFGLIITFEEVYWDLAEGAAEV